MTILSTKLLSEAQQELLLNTGLGIVHYNALTVELFALPIEKIDSENIIITSQNAIHALSCLTPANHRIYCVGTKTAQHVINLGFKVAQTANSARELAHIITTDISKNEPFTYLCGEHRRDELPAALLASKIDYKEVKVYRTVMVERAYRRIFDAVLCYSPRGVYAFAKANPKQT
ncbi:MAG: uroporphyrinogen-III synthase, partial [Nonlabens sp.]|nr:uroporphyrinogen-III synthase [Nonlabens sp.]